MNKSTKENKKMKWYVTLKDNDSQSKKVLTIKASTKQEAIQKATQKTGLHLLLNCQMIKTF